MSVKYAEWCSGINCALSNLKHVVESHCAVLNISLTRISANGDISRLGSNHSFAYIGLHEIDHSKTQPMVLLCYILVL